MQYKQLDWEKKSVDGYKPSEVRVLICIEHEALQVNSETKVSDISKILKVTPPSITQILNKLEREGLVERRMDTNDRRVVLVKLTKEGKNIARKGKNNFIKMFHELHDYLGDEDSQELARLLTRTFTFFSESKNL